MSSARVYLSSGLTVQFDQKALLISYVVVHARVDQCRIALTDVDTTTLSESEHISTKGLVDSSKDKHTHLARLAYTLMLASVAVPSMERPPPTCQTQQTLRSSGGHWKLLLGRSKASGCTHFLPPCFRTR